MATVTPELSSASKRPRSTPTLLTPHRPRKIASLRTSDVVIAVRRLSLDDSHESQPPSSCQLSPSRLSDRTLVSWGDSELKFLTEFILFHCPGDKWPTHKNMRFWNEAGQYIKRRTEAVNLRLGKGYNYSQCSHLTTFI